MTFVSTLVADGAQATQAAVTVNVQNAASGAKLDAWIDFDQNGSWLDAGEQIATNQAVSAGDNTLSFTIPAGAATGDTYARFRLSSAGGLTPTGSADDGEVEDHSVTLVASGSSPSGTVALPAGGGTTETEVTGGNVVVTRGGVVLSSTPTGTLSSLTLTGTPSENDTFHVDISTTGLPDTISVDGGSAGYDTLEIDDGTVVTANFSFANRHDGSTQWDTDGDSVDDLTIDYTGLEPIDSTIETDHVVLRYSDDAETITIVDSGEPGRTTVLSTNGETVTFENPTQSLTIYAGEGGDDVINVQGLGSGFAAALTIDGQGGTDTVNFRSAATNTGGGALTVTAEAINVNAPITSGDLTFTADRLAIAALVNVGGADVTLRPADATETIGIGDRATGTFNLSEAELTTHLASAGTVTIGRADGTGEVHVTRLDLSAESYDLEILGDLRAVVHSSQEVTLDNGARVIVVDTDRANDISLSATDPTADVFVVADDSDGIAQITLQGDFTGLGLICVGHVESIEDLRPEDAEALSFVWVDGDLGRFTSSTGLAGTMLADTVVDLAGGDFDFDAESGGDPDGDAHSLSPTALWVLGDLGTQYRIKRRGKRRWVTAGLDVAGDVSGAMAIGGQALIVELDGELDGALTVGEDLEQLAIEDGTTTYGTINVSGDLGYQYSRRRNGRRRWYTRGFWSGDDVAGAIRIAGTAWLVDIDGQVQAELTVGRDAESIVLDEGSSAAGDVTVQGALGSLTADGTTFAGDLTAGSIGQADINGTEGLAGQIDVAGDVHRLHVAHGTGAGANIDIDGDLGRRYRRKRRGRRRWHTEGLWLGDDLSGALTVRGHALQIAIDGHVAARVDVDGDVGTFTCGGQIQSAVSIGGDLTDLTAEGGSCATGTLEVDGDLGTRYRRTRNGRRRWITLGLWSRSSWQSDVTVGGTAWLVDVDGDLADATVVAQELGTVRVSNRIRSTHPETIRSLLATSPFYLSDSTWAGDIVADSPQLFDGTVTAQVG